MIRVGSVANTGAITANGVTPPASIEDAAGGGGGGGSIVFTASHGSLTGLTVAANGAAGANAWPTQDQGTCGTPPGSSCQHHGPGGGGGGGVILLSSSPASSSVTGGANGTTDTQAVAYGATSGTAGTAATNILPANIPGVSSGAECQSLNNFLNLFY
jgi:hypothetical protein